MWIVGIIFILFTIIYSAIKEGDRNAQAWLVVIIIFILFIVIAGLFMSCGNNNTSSFTNDKIVCRMIGCGKTPVYTDWNRRFCSTHIQDNRYCRRSGCMNKVPNSSTSKYCYEHD